MRWESTGEGDYTLESVSKDLRGTEVTLHLRQDEDELLSGHRIRTILHKYSDHITIPILMPKEAAPSDESSDSDDAPVVSESVELEKVNQASALGDPCKSRHHERAVPRILKNTPAHDFSKTLDLHSRQGRRTTRVHRIFFTYHSKRHSTYTIVPQRHGLKTVRTSCFSSWTEQNSSFPGISDSSTVSLIPMIYR
ncbi:MAG: hypothetical protein Ct9H300mP25_05490 [Acidobacteriota bacterium]|nr:MAG: hypothetical protein Ct9H300mP25_05490 [Acidobacteriota bacterium]